MDRPINRVAITGFGIVAPGVSSVRAFSGKLRKGESTIGSVSAFPQMQSLGLNSGSVFGSDELLRVLNQEPLLQKFARSKLYASVGSMALPVQCAIACVADAFSDRGFCLSYDPEDISIVVGGSNVGCGYQHSMRERFKDKMFAMPPLYALRFMDTDIVGTLSELFCIQGEGFTVGGASASGNVAIIKGYQAIVSKTCKVCVVVGVPSDLSCFEIQSLKNMGALNNMLEDMNVCAPFDIAASGFVYGQGAGCLVLEDYECAVNRAADIKGELLGGAICIDGNSSSNPSVVGESRAMQKALTVSGILPSDVDYVNAHGSSSPLGDKVEAQAISSVFGSNANIRVNSTKSIVGHCLSAAGVIEAIATLVQMEGGFIHPNLNLSNPISSDIGLAGNHAETKDIRVAMSNSFGFGGINTSVVLRAAVLC